MQGSSGRGTVSLPERAVSPWWALTRRLLAALAITAAHGEGAAKITIAIRPGTDAAIDGALAAHGATIALLARRADRLDALVWAIHELMIEPAGHYRRPQVRGL